MKPMFAPTDTIEDPVSLEELNKVYQGQVGISTESLTTFMARLKDRFQSAIGQITFQSNDEIFKPILGRQFELKAKTKELNFSTFRANMTVKPVNFEGLYIDYSKTLVKHAVAKNFIEMVKNYLNETNQLIGLLINSETTGGTTIPRRTIDQSKVIEQRYKEVTGDIGRFYTGKRDVTRTEFRKILKGWNDIPVLLSDCTRLDRNFRFSDVEAIKKLSDTLGDNVETLLDMLDSGHMTASFGARNSIAGRDRKMTHTVIWNAAQSIELTAYLYTNLFDYTGALKVNIDDILKY